MAGRVYQICTEAHFYVTVNLIMRAGTLLKTMQHAFHQKEVYSYNPASPWLLPRPLAVRPSAASLPPRHHVSGRTDEAPDLDLVY